MASVLYKQYRWHFNALYNGSQKSGVLVVIDSSSGNTAYSNSTDANGNIEAVVTGSRVDITTSISETDYNPYALFVGAYLLQTRAGTITFASERKDTFNMVDDVYITETDEGVVSGYTGIAVDNSAKTITVTANHTIYELYDYCKHVHTQNPDMDNAAGIITTDDGVTFKTNYALTIDGAQLTDNGNGVFFDMRNSALTLANGGGADFPIKHNAGTRTFIRVYAKDIVGGAAVSGARAYVEEQGGGALLNALTDSNGYVYAVYNHTGDIDVNGRVRRGTTQPYYKTAKFSGTVKETGLDITVYMQRDE